MLFFGRQIVLRVFCLDLWVLKPYGRWYGPTCPVTVPKYDDFFGSLKKVVDFFGTNFQFN